MDNLDAPVILYTNLNDANDHKYGFPNMNCGLTIDEIIAKDTPKGYSASLITQEDYRKMQ